VAFQELRLFLESSRRSRKMSGSPEQPGYRFLMKAVGDVPSIDIPKQGMDTSPVSDITNSLSLVVADLQGEKFKIKTALETQSEQSRQLAEELRILKMEQKGHSAPGGETENFKDLKKYLIKYRATLEEAIAAVSTLREESLHRAEQIKQIKHHLSTREPLPSKGNGALIREKEERIRSLEQELIRKDREHEEEKRVYVISVTQLQEENQSIHQELSKTQKRIEEESREGSQNKEDKHAYDASVMQLREELSEYQGLLEEKSREKFQKEEEGKAYLASIKKLQEESRVIHQELSKSQELLELKTREVVQKEEEIRVLENKSEDRDHMRNREVEEFGAELSDVRSQLEEEGQRRQAAVKLIEELRMKLTNLGKEEKAWEEIFAEVDHAWTLTQRKAF